MPLKIEIFSSPGCGKCTQARNQLLKLSEEYSTNKIDIVEVNVLEQLDYVVSLGIVTTPAIAINGKLRFTELPSIQTLKAEVNSIIGKG